MAPLPPERLFLKIKSRQWTKTKKQLMGNFLKTI